MNVMKISFLLVLMLSGGILLGQEQPYMLSLAQAQEYALQHNRSILNARDQVESSKKKVYETIANGLPQIEGSLDYMTYFNYELYLDFGGGGGAGFEQLFTDPDIDAGDIKVLQALGSMFGSSEPIIMDDQFSGKIQVSQLIFSGQYIAGIQVAKIARRLADQNLLSNELDVKENVTNSYYNILTTEQTLRILGENLDNLNSLLEHTHNLFKAGLAEETDVDRIRMSVSQLKNTQKSLERLNQLNYNLLKFQLGVAPDASISLTDSLEYFIENINPDVALVNNFDVNNNVNYQMIESQVKMTKKQVDMQYWAYTPTIAGFYSYTEKFITTGFDMTPNHLAGVSVSVPIFSSGMRNSQVSQAKINLDIAQRNQEMVKDQLETQNSQLLYNYQSAFDNFNTQKENVDVAARVYEKVKNKYKQGMASSFELTQENSNFLSAESNYLSALSSLLQAQTMLDKLYNRL